MAEIDRTVFLAPPLPSPPSRLPVLLVERFALLTLFAGAICIGFAPILVRLSEVGPSATAFYRLLFALPILWWWMRRENGAPQKARRRPASPKDFALLAAAGLLFIGDLSIWHWSLQYTTVANSTLLTNFAPLFVTLGAWMFLRETITGWFLISLALSLPGAALLTGNSLTWSSAHLFGDLLALLTALFYGAYLLMVKRLREDFSGLTIMSWSGLVACPGFLLVGAFSNECLWPATVNGWLVLMALGFLSHLGGQTLIATALGHLPASFSAVGLLLQPIVATLAAWFLFRETLTPMQSLGGLAILVGIALARRARRR